MGRHGAEMERRFTAAVQLEDVTTIDRVTLWTNTGHTPLLTGQGSDPVIELRTSNDAGNTWSDWEAESLGTEGNTEPSPNGVVWGCSTGPER
jgi:hypothetical protein